MKFSYLWIKDYLEGSLPDIKKAAEILSDHTFEAKVIGSGKNAVLDIKLLANRVPDASGHLAIAKELASLTNLTLKEPKNKLKESSEKIKDYLNVSVLENQLCFRYATRMVLDIKVGESPLWLKERIKACGLKPINNVVDITNFVMLEYGQPLHAFDYDKISDKKGIKQIIVRKAKKGEKIITLDNTERILDESILLIADPEKPLAIAGIKGGVFAEISSKTKRIVIEAANFEGVNIRKASQKLNLKTDASWRYEHNISPYLIDLALDRAASLISEICQGKVLKGKIDVLKKLPKINPIIFNLDKASDFLGLEVKTEEAIKILKSFGFLISKTKKSRVLLVTPPVVRKDIEGPSDLAGEIIRYWGYNKLPSTPIKEFLKVAPINELWQFKSLMRHWLKGVNLQEVYNYAFMCEAEKNLLDSKEQKKIVEILNPNSIAYKYFKTNLILNLVKNVSDNYRFYDQVNLFEIGKNFHWQNKKVLEETMLSGVLAVKDTGQKELFYSAKSLLVGVLNKMGLDTDDFSFNQELPEAYQSVLNPNSAVTLQINDEIIGVMGEPSNDVKKYYDVSGHMVVWEIFLEKLMLKIDEEREYEPLPKYQAVIRDLSLLAFKQTSAEEIIKTISQTAGNLLEDVDLFDIYEGKNIQSNKKSMAFHLIFRAPDHALKSEEIDQAMNAVYNAFKKLNIEIR